MRAHGLCFCLLCGATLVLYSVDEVAAQEIEYQTPTSQQKTFKQDRFVVRASDHTAVSILTDISMTMTEARTSLEGDRGIAAASPSTGVTVFEISYNLRNRTHSSDGAEGNGPDSSLLITLLDDHGEKIGRAVSVKIGRDVCAYGAPVRRVVVTKLFGLVEGSASMELAYTQLHHRQGGC